MSLATSDFWPTHRADCLEPEMHDVLIGRDGLGDPVEVVEEADDG